MTAVTNTNIVTSSDETTFLSKSVDF